MPMPQLKVRVISMVAPTEVPDNYVSAVFDLTGVMMAAGQLPRFDIGHDEGTMKTTKLEGFGGEITFDLKM